MNATVRTMLVFALLVGAVVLASFLYRRSASGTEAKPDVGAAVQTVDETSLHPELKLALDAFGEGREEDAIQHFRAVPADSPNYPTVLRHLAILTARQGNYDEAIASLLQLVGQHQDDPEIHASLGWVFYLAERHEDAEFAALRALELDPGHVATRFNIGLYRIAQGRTQLAISSYIRAMRMDPNGTQITRHRDRLRLLHDAHHQFLHVEDGADRAADLDEGLEMAILPRLRLGKLFSQSPDQRVGHRRALVQVRTRIELR